MSESYSLNFVLELIFSHRKMIYWKRITEFWTLNDVYKRMYVLHQGPAEIRLFLSRQSWELLSEARSRCLRVTWRGKLRIGYLGASPTCTVAYSAERES